MAQKPSIGRKFSMKGITVLVIGGFRCCPALVDIEVHHDRSYGPPVGKDEVKSDTRDSGSQESKCAFYIRVLHLTFLAPSVMEVWPEEYTINNDTCFIQWV